MDHIYQDIPGWFVGEKVYARAVREAKDGARFVEVGSWKGKSTSFMAVEIANSGKNIEFLCVDHWEGSEERAHKADEDVQAGTLFDAFNRNVEPVKDYIKPLRMSSLEAAAQFEDDSLDFVYLDAAHDYENVKADIAAWLPKLKKGGTIAGDDYALPWVGVMKAVDEAFGGLKPLSIANTQWVSRK